MVRKIATGSVVALVLGMLAFGASRGCSPVADHTHDTQGVEIPTDAGDPSVTLPPTVPPTTPTMPVAVPTIPPPGVPTMPAIPAVVASDVPAPAPIRTLPEPPTPTPPPYPEAPR